MVNYLKWKDWQRVLCAWGPNGRYGNSGMSIQLLSNIIKRPARVVLDEMLHNKLSGVWTCRVVEGPMWGWDNQYIGKEKKALEETHMYLKMFPPSVYKGGFFKGRGIRTVKGALDNLGLHDVKELRLLRRIAAGKYSPLYDDDEEYAY